MLSVDLFGAGDFAFLPTPRCICHHQLPLHCRWPSDPAASLTKLHDKTGWDPLGIGDKIRQAQLSLQSLKACFFLERMGTYIWVFHNIKALLPQIKFKLFCPSHKHQSGTGPHECWGFVQNVALRSKKTQMWLLSGGPHVRVHPLLKASGAGGGFAEALVLQLSLEPTCPCSHSLVPHLPGRRRDATMAQLFVQLLSLPRQAANQPISQGCEGKRAAQHRANS